MNIYSLGGCILEDTEFPANHRSTGIQPEFTWAIIDEERGNDGK